MPKIGDIYTVIIYYKGQSGNNKQRPVIITNTLNNGEYTIAEITSIPPKDPPIHHDKFKEPIVLWQECGLDQPSWVKCHKGNVHNIAGSRLHQYVGAMDSHDFQNAVMNIYYNN